jgi:hypothetical protein
MRPLTTVSRLIVFSVLASALAAAPVRAQPPVEGGPDPSTAYGRSVLQNQQYMDEEREREQQDQQNREEQQERDRQNRDEQNQYYGGSQSYGDEEPNGPYGSVSVDPADPKIERYSFNYVSPQAARTAAYGACTQAARTPCKEAVTFANGCAAEARSPAGVWAVRVARSMGQARIDAAQACRAAGGRGCTVKFAYCSPRPN